jgi:hypothetical protein
MEDKKLYYFKFDRIDHENSELIIFSSSKLEAIKRFIEENSMIMDLMINNTESNDELQKCSTCNENHGIIYDLNTDVNILANHLKYDLNIEIRKIPFIID